MSTRQALLDCSKTELMALIASDKNRSSKARLICAVKLFDKLGALNVNNPNINGYQSLRKL